MTTEGAAFIASALTKATTECDPPLEPGAKFAIGQAVSIYLGD